MFVPSYDADRFEGFPSNPSIIQFGRRSHSGGAARDVGASASVPYSGASERALIEANQD